MVSFNFKQFSLAYKYTVEMSKSSILPIDRTYQALPLGTRVKFVVMAMKGYSAFPKLQDYWSLHIRLFNVISRTLVGIILPLCRGAVGVFYSASRLGQNVL